MVHVQGDINFDNWKEFVPDLLLVIITAVFLPLTITDIVLQIRAERVLGMHKQNDIGNQQGGLKRTGVCTGRKEWRSHRLGMWLRFGT